MRIFIGCSESGRVPNKYQDLASQVSEILALRNHKLVIDASGKGMVNRCYMTFKYHDCKVKGIADIKDIDEINSLELDASKVVPSTFERTKSFYESSEVLVFLPGGINTISELFQMLTEKSTRKDNKPIILFNYDGFYDDIIHLIKFSNSLNFINDNNILLLNIVSDIEEFEKIIKKIEEEN